MFAVYFSHQDIFRGQNDNKIYDRMLDRIAC